MRIITAVKKALISFCVLIIIFMQPLNVAYAQTEDDSDDSDWENVPGKEDWEGEPDDYDPDTTGYTVEEDPGEEAPVGFDWSQAEVSETIAVTTHVDDTQIEWEIVCDPNWCVVPGYDPDWDFTLEQEYGQGLPSGQTDMCWNYNGDLCIWNPNPDSEIASDYLFALAIWNQTLGMDVWCGDGKDCEIIFPEIIGSYEEWLAALEAGEAPPPPAPPPAVYCPADTVELGEIRVTAELVAPPYPVVIGQDPAKRGADIQWRIEIDPTIHTWYEEIVHYDQRVCYSVPEGTGSGCPGPASRYDNIQGADRWFEWMENDSNWQSEGGQPRVECVKHVDVYVEQLNWVRPQANLSQASREWIQHGELQDRYPGADLYQPDWEFSPGAGGTTTGSGTFIWEWINLRTQLKDPGFWLLSLRAMTTGTPVSGPRSINEGGGSFNVWMHEATLSE